MLIIFKLFIKYLLINIFKCILSHSIKLFIINLLHEDQNQRHFNSSKNSITLILHINQIKVGILAPR